MKIAPLEESWKPKLSDQEYIALIDQLRNHEISDEDEPRIMGTLDYYYPIIECMHPALTAEEILEKAKTLRKPILL